MKDLLVAQARSEVGRGETGNLQMMRVSELRKLAHKKGLSADGSREMLIASIKGDEEDA